MSYKNRLFEVIDQDIKWHQEHNPDYIEYTERENEILKKGFLLGMEQAKHDINQMWKIDIENPVEAIEDMICSLEEYLDEDDMEAVHELCNLR
jgi:hypothetical protein